jgi:hypothetical protein
MQVLHAVGKHTFRLYLGSTATAAPSKCCGIKMGIPVLPQRACSKSLCRVVISFLKTQTPQQSLLTPILSCTKTLTALLHTSHKGRLETLLLERQKTAVLPNTPSFMVQVNVSNPGKSGKHRLLQLSLLCEAFR